MLVFTLGDPHSVNIEILRDILDDQTGQLSRVKENMPVIVCGSNWHWRDQERRSQKTAFRFDQIISQGAPIPDAGILFLDLPNLATEVSAENLTSSQRGRVAVAALEAAVELRPSTGTYAVVTGPIDKHACSSAGFTFPGQTEFFSEAFGGEAVMLLAGDKLKVGLTTNHLALADVSARISKELIVRKGRQLAVSLRDLFNFEQPRIAVCGLNPHAGDHGMFGREEIDLIAPAVAELNRDAFGTFSGPHPADTVFYRTVQGRFDAVLAMYHDQGLGPLKTLHFDDGVNISGGLAHLRVSPDHGPAKDLFLKGQASDASFKAAVVLAVNYLAKKISN